MESTSAILRSADPWLSRVSIHQPQTPPTRIQPEPPPAMHGFRCNALQPERNSLHTSHTLDTSPPFSLCKIDGNTPNVRIGPFAPLRAGSHFPPYKQEAASSSLASPTTNSLKFLSCGKYRSCFYVDYPQGQSAPSRTLKHHKGKILLLAGQKRGASMPYP